MPRARLGVVLPVPAPAAAEVDGMRRAVGRVGVERVGPHVTLVPPVNVSSQALSAALDIVRGVAAAAPPLRLVLGPPASFWPATPVVYLPVGGDVERVVRMRDAVAVGPWDRPTTWPFIPHVTIAPEVDPDLIPAALALLAGYRREITATCVHVLEEGADRTWGVLAEVRLSGRRVVGRGGLEVVIDGADTLDVEALEELDGWWAGHLASIDRSLPWGRPFGLSARREGAIVGAAQGATDDELWLDRIAVNPAVRGEGIGRHLLRAVETLGAERGCSRAFLVCEADSPSRGWCRANGWREDLDLPAWRHGRRFVRLVRLL